MLKNFNQKNLKILQPLSSIPVTLDVLIFPQTKALVNLVKILKQ